MKLLPVGQNITADELVLLNNSKGGKLFTEVKLTQLMSRVIGGGYKTYNERRAYLTISAKKGYNVATVDLLSGRISLNHNDLRAFDSYRIAKEEAALACQFYNLRHSELHENGTQPTNQLEINYEFS